MDHCTAVKRKECAQGCVHTSQLNYMHAHVSLCACCYPSWEDNSVFTERRRKTAVSAVSLLTVLLSDPRSAGAAVFWGAEYKAGRNSVHKAAQVCKTWQHY